MTVETFSAPSKERRESESAWREGRGGAQGRRESGVREGESGGGGGGEEGERKEEKLREGRVSVDVCIYISRPTPRVEAGDLAKAQRESKSERERERKGMRKKDSEGSRARARARERERERERESLAGTLDEPLRGHIFPKRTSGAWNCKPLPQFLKCMNIHTYRTHTRTTHTTHTHEI
jgi:hypothetical protein